MLTRAQQKAYVFIASTIERTYGIAPSRQEIADHLGLASKGNATAIIERLERRGYLRVLPGRARAIEPLVPLKTKVFRFDPAEKRLVELVTEPTNAAGATSA